jgi:uncharacterized protein
MRFISFLSALWLLGACKAQPGSPQLVTNKDNNTLLWEISGKGLKKPSFLFGTFHLMCKKDIQFSEQLKKALKASDELYLEIDMDDPAILLGGMMLMNMKDNKKLKDLYTVAEFNKLETYFKDSLSMPLLLMQRMKPLFLESLLYPKMMPCKQVSGVEEELMKLARIDRKEIRGLETMEFQSSVFDSIPYEEQARDLIKTIDSIGAYQAYFKTMINVYKNQQLDKMEELFSKSEFGMEDNKDILLDSRNKNWVKQLNVIMKAGAVFVAVGAGHLPGTMGVITLLKKEGYILRPIGND